jgi:CubicO group peptidase (beta-lactamase class C family)
MIALDRRHFLASLAAAALSPGEALSKTVAPATLQTLISNYVGTKRLAGAAVALTTGNGRPKILKAGRVAFDADLAFDEHSVCRVYSMTKPVTGLATMLLVESGKLRLDQPVADIVPELQKPLVALDPKRGFEARAATRTMTIRHLLTHTAGLAYWIPSQGTDALSTAYRAQGITPGNYYPTELARPGYGPQANGLEDMVARLAEIPLVAEPGTMWRYSVGLDVMGRVIERVSGKPLDAFTHEHFFAPLKMRSTGFVVPRSATSRLTTNYTVTPTGLVPLDRRELSVFLKPPRLLAGGAGLVSTAHDFSRFGAMLLNEGKLDGVRVLRAETVRLAVSNLLPSSVKYDGGGFGAGMRVATGGPKPRDSKGAVSWNGAAGTMWIVDSTRKLNFVFMSQFMPPTSYLIWDEASSALQSMGL